MLEEPLLRLAFLSLLVLLELEDADGTVCNPGKYLATLGSVDATTSTGLGCDLDKGVKLVEIEDGSRLVDVTLCPLEDGSLLCPSSSLVVDRVWVARRSEGCCWRRRCGGPRW